MPFNDSLTKFRTFSNPISTMLPQKIAQEHQQKTFVTLRFWLLTRWGFEWIYLKYNDVFYEFFRCKKCVLSFKKRGWDGGGGGACDLLSRQNLLSMAKMICWWPLMTPKMFFHLNIITLTKCITLKYFTKAIRNPVPYK